MRSVSFTINIPCSNTLWPHSFSALLWGNCCICIEVSMLKPVPLVSHQSQICKSDVMAGKGIQLSIRKSQTIDPLPARHRRIEDGFSWQLPSFCPTWLFKRKVSPHWASCVDCFLLKWVGRYSWPSLRQTQIALQGRRGQLVRDIKLV